MKKFLKVAYMLLIVSLASSVLSVVAAASEQNIPYVNEFNDNGVLNSGTDGISYTSGKMEVVDGILKLRESGTQSVSGKKGTFIELDFETVSSGVLVFETDWYPPTVGAALTDGYIFMSDSTGKDVVRIFRSSGGANKMYVNRYVRVNGSTDPAVNDEGLTCLNNSSHGAQGARSGLKIEIDLDRGVYRVYQAISMTDGKWAYRQLQRKNYEGIVENEFPFADPSATNVTSLRWAFQSVEAIGDGVPGSGLDNIKIYKKFTSAPAQSTYDMLEGETMQAQLNFAPATESVSGLIWESNDTSIATVDSNGIITARSKGTTTVTVKHNFYTFVNHTFTVNVVNGATGLAIDKTESTIALGDSVRLSLSPIPENTTYRNVVWSSSNESIATVDNGVVTGVGKGTATITATATGKDGATLTVTSVVNVLKPLTGLSISAPKTSFEVDESATFSAVIIPADASNVVKTWRSGNHYIATVDQNGRVTAVGEGSTEIFVSASGFTASKTITVNADGNSVSNRKPSLISFYTPSGFSFYDIADMEWAQSSVYSAVESGCISPDSDTSFGAKRNIKRDEFVSVVIKTFGLSGEIENPEALKNFTDVSEDNAYYSEIMKALDLGIIQGVSDTEFAPDADITRQDMSVVIVNAMKVAGVKTEEGRLDFADKDSIAEYAQTAVRILSKMEIIKGKSANMFDPLANTTRAEVAVIVDRINANR